MKTRTIAGKVFTLFKRKTRGEYYREHYKADDGTHAHFNVLIIESRSKRFNPWLIN